MMILAYAVWAFAIVAVCAVVAFSERREAIHHNERRPR